MSDDQKRSVSEISHLFLSNVRDLAGNGQPRPQRTPPPGQRPAVEPQAEMPAMKPAAELSGIDLTPEEFEHVFTTPASAALGRMEADDDGATIAPVTALLASHLTVRHHERVRDYARHLAMSSGRVGLIELDAAEFRLSCFDPGVEPGVESESRPVAQTGTCDPREVAEALEELNADVDCWVVSLPPPRTPESKALARACEHWTLLTTCDHDGVVAAYRTLKGWAEVRQPATTLSLVSIETAGDAEAARVHQKLAGVCKQFLDWDVLAEPAVRYAAGVAEHPVMNCRVARDKAQLASAPHWSVVSDFLGRDRRDMEDAEPAMPAVAAMPAEVAMPAAEPEITSKPVEPTMTITQEPAARTIHRVEFAAEPMPTSAPAPAAKPAMPEAAPAAASLPPGPIPMPTMTMPTMAMPAMSMPMMVDDVIDLPGDLSDAAAILGAMMHRPECGMVECPLMPPGTNAASPLRLAVTRDRTLTVVGVARRGLGELRAIGMAYRWASENLALIRLAMPQFAIDTSRTPGVMLMVDQSDTAADVLRPMMGAGHVTIRAYRTLRWAGRTGLLLEAA